MATRAKAGVSFFRTLNAKTLREVDEPVTIEVEGIGVAVLMPLALYEALSDGVVGAPDQSRTPDPAVMEVFMAVVLKAMKEELKPMEQAIDETLEMLRSAPQLEDIGTLLGHLLSPAVSGPAYYSHPLKPALGMPEPMEEPMEMPKEKFGPTCKHCGGIFAGMRYATICPECKSTGHTLTPAECPRCTEGAQL